MLIKTQQQLRRAKIIYFMTLLTLDTAFPTNADDIFEEPENLISRTNTSHVSNIELTSYSSKLGIIDGYFDPKSNTRKALTQSTECAYLGKDPTITAFQAHAREYGRDHANAIASVIYQMNQHTRLRVIDLCNEPFVKDKETHDACLIAAIDIAIESKVDFINISQRLSPDCDENKNKEISQELKNAFYRARDKNIGIIKSAGNDNEMIGFTPYTKSLANLVEEMQGYMIIAGAMSNEDGIETLAKFSNRAGTASKYTVIAPGTRIIVCGASNVLVEKYGTSLAAAFVTATAGLLKEAHPTLSAYDILKSIRRSARKVSLGGRTSFFQGKYGRGIVDYDSALKEAEKIYQKYNQASQN